MRRVATFLFVMSAGLGVAWAQPNSEAHVYSPYEEQTIARVLARHGVTVDATPEGKLIEDVAVEVLDVIEDRDPLPEALNAFHCTTRQHAIRRELLFKEGQPFERALSDETERNLRSLRQQSLVVVLPLKGSAPDRVRVLVLGKDIWSLRLNTAYRITGRGIEALFVEPSEENLFGMRRSILSTFAYDPVTLSFGVRYIEPRLADSRILFSGAVNAIVNHETGKTEGSFGSFDYGVPIYSTRQKWAWGGSVAWREATTRRFSGTDLAVFNGDPETDPTNTCPNAARCIPVRYKSDVIAGTLGVTRSFPGKRVQLVQLGLSADRRVYNPGDLGAYDADVAQRFLEQRVPTSVTRNGAFARYQNYENRYAKLQEVESLGLQENFRLGFEGHARIYPILTAFGSTQTLLGYSSALSYTRELGDGLVRVLGAAGVEVPPAHDAIVNATVQGGLRLVTPRLGVGRLVADSTFTLRPYNGLNVTSSLGGDGRLRGYLSGFILGENVFAANLEFRTRSVQLWTFQMGGALFYDVGDAFDSSSDFRLKQGAGMGVRLGFPQLDRTVMRIDLGFPLTRGLPRSGWLDGLVITFDQAFDMPAVGSAAVVR